MPNPDMLHLSFAYYRPDLFDWHDIKENIIEEGYENAKTWFGKTQDLSHSLWLLHWTLHQTEFENNMLRELFTQFRSIGDKMVEAWQKELRVDMQTGFAQLDSQNQKLLLNFLTNLAKEREDWERSREYKSLPAYKAAEKKYTPGPHLALPHQSEQEMSKILGQFVGQKNFSFHAERSLAQTIDSEKINMNSDEKAYFLMAALDYYIEYQDKNQTVAFAIELDGSSHSSPEAQKKDALKNLLLQKAGLPLLRIQTDVLQKHPLLVKGLVALMLEKPIKLSKQTEILPQDLLQADQASWINFCTKTQTQFRLFYTEDVLLCFAKQNTFQAFAFLPRGFEWIGKPVVDLQKVYSRYAQVKAWEHLHTQDDFFSLKVDHLNN